MSMTALLHAVADRVKTALTLTDANVGISYDGKPPAFEGEEFFVVHPGSVRNSADLSLDELYGVSVTLTRRTAFSPQDRIGTAIMAKVTLGLYARADKVKVALHKSEQVLDLIGGTTELQTWTGGKSYSLENSVEGFIESLVFDRYSDEPMQKGPEWLWATPKGGHMNSQPAALALEIRFRDARRIQTIESMT